MNQLAYSVVKLVEADTIILKKYEPACVFCGQAKGVQNLKGKNVCPSCIVEIGNLK